MFYTQCFIIFIIRRLNAVHLTLEMDFAKVLKFDDGVYLIFKFQTGDSNPIQRPFKPLN